MPLQNGEGRQLSLLFPTADPVTLPMIETGPYAPVRRMLDRWQNWPEGQLALVGPKGSGKTRIGLQWASEVSAAFVDGADLSEADISQISSLSVSALVVDNAENTQNGPNLLAAMNLTRDRKVPIMLTGTTDPSAWELDPADLRSRLLAIPVMHIGALDDDTLKARLVAACKVRFMKLPEETAIYLAERLDRRHSNIDRIAKALEHSAEGKALTKNAARRALESLTSAENDAE